jgi:hypothetical protein
VFVLLALTFHHFSLTQHSHTQEQILFRDLHSQNETAAQQRDVFLFWFSKEILESFSLRFSLRWLYFGFGEHFTIHKGILITENELILILIT